MNFYLASSGIIPVMAVLVLIDINTHPMAKRRPPKWLAQLLERVDSHAVERGGHWQAPLLGGYICWAEFICLRTLETGRVPFGGAAVVWIALAVLAGLAVCLAWIMSLPIEE